MISDGEDDDTNDGGGGEQLNFGAIDPIPKINDDDDSLPKLNNDGEKEEEQNTISTIGGSFCFLILSWELRALDRCTAFSERGKG